MAVSSAFAINLLISSSVFGIAPVSHRKGICVWDVLFYLASHIQYWSTCCNTIAYEIYISILTPNGSAAINKLQTSAFWIATYRAWISCLNKMQYRAWSHWSQQSFNLHHHVGAAVSTNIIFPSINFILVISEIFDDIIDNALQTFSRQWRPSIMEQDLLQRHSMLHASRRANWRWSGQLPTEALR